MECRSDGSSPALRVRPPEGGPRATGRRPATRSGPKARPVGPTKKTSRLCRQQLLGGWVLYVSHRPRPGTPPRIPTWVIRLSDSGGLETKLEFVRRHPQGREGESKGFLGSQSGPAGSNGVPAAHHWRLWRGGFGWEVLALVSALKPLLPSLQHAEVAWEYSVNTIRFP